MTSRRIRITVRGRLSERFASRFAGLVREPIDQDTVLVGEFATAAQFEVMLGRIADCGLEVLGVEEGSSAPTPPVPTGDGHGRNP